MTQDHAFDKDYWDQHWEHDRPQAAATPPANPYLIRETSDLVPGTALDAGCGEGAEAIWLASRGWHVTAADIAAEALARAASRAAFAADVTAVLDGARWEIDTAEEHFRTLDGHDGRAIHLRDAVVRAIRLGQRPTR